MHVCRWNITVFSFVGYRLLLNVYAVPVQGIWNSSSGQLTTHIQVSDQWDSMFEEGNSTRSVHTPESLDGDIMSLA